jgi:mRNA interferase RelE/StbE
MRQIEKGDSSISYKIFETKQFLKDINKIKGKSHLKLREKLDNYVYPQLRNEPHFGNNIKKLVDWEPDTWRYRIGENRLFYEIDEEEKVVFILTFDPRGSAYKS